MKIWKWPILYVIIQMFILVLLAVFYTALGYSPSDFGLFLNKYRFLVGLLLGIVFLPWLIRTYKKMEIPKKRLPIKTIIFIVIFGIVLCILYNVVIFYITMFLDINAYVKNEYIWSMLITTGIIGPLIEEYMFRGILYNELKNKYRIMKSILLCTIVFTLLHVTFMQMVYAFAFGFLLIYVYEKYQTLKAPILLHLFSNITSVFVINILLQNNFTLNYSLFIISFIIFGIIVFLHKRNMI